MPENTLLPLANPTGCHWRVCLLTHCQGRVAARGRISIGGAGHLSNR